MTILGTPLTQSATRLMLLGSGELGKEVAIEAQRLGVEVIAVDRYPNAPAMQIAHRSHVISMLDAAALRQLIEAEKPDFVVPEIEAIATDVLLELEAAGRTIIPTARATRLTMDREGIRRLAAEELGLATSPYRFADTKAEFLEACRTIGFPLRGQAGHVLLGQGAKRGPGRRLCRSRLGLCPDRRPGRSGAGHRGRLRGLRL